MDPDACLRLLHEAIEDGDRDGAIEAAEALAGWLRRGGFMPKPLPSWDDEEVD